jgi:hypothetical protein
MSENLAIESPDFPKIRKESGLATEDAVRLLWFVLNQEIRDRRVGVRRAQELREGKVFSASPSGTNNNLDVRGAWVAEFSSAGGWTLTGIRNGIPGRFLVIHNLGAGTITLNHESASSDAANRFVFQSGANKSVAQNRSLLLQYLSSRWREVSLA